VNTLRQTGLFVFALANAACSNGIFASHACTAIYPICDQTAVTLQSPGNMWSAGTYALAANIDGNTAQCSLRISEPPPTGTLQGTCSATNVTWTLTQLCPQPPPVCTNGACVGMVSSANCLAGQFQMAVTVSPQGFGPDASSAIASQIAIDLSLDGTELIDETIRPTTKTTEPNGAGCGTCTNASATLSIAGG
jgi:hypothetical protein